MWAVMIAFWGVVLWGIFALVANVTRKPGDARPGDAGIGDRRPDDEARHILDQRLARGEIDTDEYQRLLGVMESAGRRSTEVPAGTAASP